MKNRISWNIRARAFLLVILTTAAFGCGANDISARNDVTTTTTTAGGGGMGGATTGSGGSGGEGCEGQCAPLGPGEWLGPLLLWIGKPGEEPECPAAAPVEGSLVFADLNAPITCGACKCDAPSGTCALPSTLSTAAATCAGDGPGVAHTSFDAPAPWNGSCTAANPIPANQKCNGVNCVQSLSVAPLTLTETPCAVKVEPIAANLPSTWGTAARSCHGVAYGPCPAPDEICAPATEPGFAQCLFQKGDNACPDRYPTKHLFYSGFSDTRDCTPCACGAPVGGSCTAQLSVYKDNACSSLNSTVGLGSTGPTCFDVVPSGQALGSKQATEPVYAPGVCQVSGGEPTGEAIPADPSTYCCLP